MRIPRLLAGALLALAACARPAAAEPPVWHVRTAGGGEVTLFGSVHLLQETTRWRSAEVDALLARADRLMFEIPMDPEAQASAAAKIAGLGRLPEGETLRTQLPPEARARFERLCGKLGLPAEALDRLQPWMAELVLSLTFFTKAGARADLGVEQQVAKAAPASAARDAFETVDDQLAALAGGSRADQLKALAETLEELDTDPEGFARLAAAWARGDVKSIEREGLDELRRDAPGAYARLVVDRNRRWVKRIEALARSPGRTFAVVGVGHLVGPDSVPALLRRDGLAVDGPR